MLCLCGCGVELTGKQVKYASPECNRKARVYNGHYYVKHDKKTVIDGKIIYHKTCDQCKQPFETTIKRKKYCCDACYKEANLVRNRLHTYKQEDRLYKCPHCKKMESNKEYCFCDHCRWKHKVSGFNSLEGNEIYF